MESENGSIFFCANGEGKIGTNGIDRENRTIRTIGTIGTIKMIADKFPNGLIGLNPNGPIGPNRHSRPCTLLSTPYLLLEGGRYNARQKK